jgi:hypothetical protein
LEEVRKLADKFSLKKKSTTKVVVTPTYIKIVSSKGQLSARRENEVVNLIQENYPDLTVSLK